MIRTGIISAVIFIMATTFLSCKKDSNTPAVPVTVKYEITSSSPLIDTIPMGNIRYTDANGTDQTISDFFPGNSSWTKTITTVTTTRPLTLKLSTPVSYYVAGQGTMTGKIYVNNVLQAFSTTTITQSGNFFIVTLPEISAVVN